MADRFASPVQSMKKPAVNSEMPETFETFTELTLPSSASAETISVS